MAYEVDFVERYNNSMRRYGEVHEPTKRNINEAVLEEAKSVFLLADALETQAQLDGEVASYNRVRLEREGFSEDDLEKGIVPAYVTDSLATPIRSDELLARKDKERNRFFEKVYAVDSVLTDDVRDFLGEDYKAYCDEKSKASVEATTSLNGSVREGRRLPDISNVTGSSLSLVDEHGVNRDDGYVFDEP